MSGSIRIKPLELKPVDGKSFQIHYQKDKNISFEEPLVAKGDSTGGILNLSWEAKSKLKSHPRPEGDLKKSGVTSAREVFEEAGLEQRNYARGNGKEDWASGEFTDELMRIDEPETYAKVKELLQKSTESGGSGPWWREDGWGTKEGEAYAREASAVKWEWYWRRCHGGDENSRVRNPVSGQQTVIAALELKHWDSVHDTTFGAYDGKSPEQTSYLWNVHTKFNVLLPAKMLNELEALNRMDTLSQEQKDKLNQKLEQIDDAVYKMKEAEKNYEGTHMFLRFGAVMDNSGKVTYHANYSGCEDKNGISADSPEELLEKLAKS